MSDKRSLILTLYEAVHGKQMSQTSDTRQGTYDPKTRSYYCGEDAPLMNFYLSEDVKRYMQSRHFDYVHRKTNAQNKPLTPEELQINAYKAEALHQLMIKFKIPVADYSSGKVQ